jgi:peptide/nickel transport system ATP-binding protein
VDGVSFTLHQGERFGLAGESGSGKSTTALALLGLIRPPGRIEGGRIYLGERDLTHRTGEQMRRVRLAELALIPQGAMNSLNPVMRIRDHIIESLRAHENGMPNAHMHERIAKVLSLVGLPVDTANLYPHQLSGGMKQRVCIGMAIALRPKVIIADEPTSALDVVSQRQVMQTLATVQQQSGAAVLLAGHDMGLLAQFVDRLGVMYAGKLVEVGPVQEIFDAPLHPYTQLLISSLPSLEAKRALRGVPGLPPSLLSPPSGCVFHPRCPKAFGRCPMAVPVLQEAHPGRWVACHLYEDTVSMPEASG